LFTAVVFLEEKWFYYTNRRHKLRVLRLTPLETRGADVIIRPNMSSRIFAVKSMFMGASGRLITPLGLKEVSHQRCNLDEAVVKRLEFYYTTKIVKAGKTKKII